MTFRELFAAVRRGWVLVVVSALLGTLAAAGWSATRTPEYVATAQLFLGVRTATEAEDTRQDTLYLQQRMPSYAAVLGSPALGERVVDELALEGTGADVAERMTVTVPEGTVLLDVSVRDSSPERARDIANAVGGEFADYLAELENAGGSEVDAVDVTTIEPAQLPEAPASPDVVVDVLAGALLGLAIGLGLALLRAALDDTVHEPAELAALGLPSLGALPGRARRGGPARSAAREDGVRRIRRHLLTDGERRTDLQVVSVATPSAGADVGALALDLARSLVVAGESVILVDADLSAPAEGRWLDLPPDRPGLAELLSGQAQPGDALVRDSDGLRVLPAGRPSRHPADLLLPASTERVLRALAGSADRVVVVGPPLDGRTESEVVAGSADGVVLLLGAGVTRREDVRQVGQVLRALPAELIGCAVEQRG